MSGLSRTAPPLAPCHPPPASVLTLCSVPACFVRCRLSEEQNKPETARKGKTMKLEDIKSKTKDAVDYLVQSLESGHSEVLTQYLGAMARFHTYSFGNVMLIARQKPDASNVAGIRTWNLLGRFVKRGEKGILILAPMVGNRRSRQNEIATDINTDNAADERKPEHALIGFRAVYVFDRLSRDLRPSLCARDVCRECHFR
jgi:antirestriction factor ArdC-like protein